MNPPAAKSGTVYSPGMVVRKLRLWSGLILLAFLLFHLVNQSLGMVSLAAMDATRKWAHLYLHNRVVGVILYGSLIVHSLSSLWAVFQRRHFRLCKLEILHITSSFFIVPLLVSHFVGIHVAREWFGVHNTYSSSVYYLWALSPGSGLRQSILMLVAWLHASLGIHYWLRPKSWYAPMSCLLLLAAVLMPVCALVGFSQAGREVARLAEDTAWPARLDQATGVLDKSQKATLDSVEFRLHFAYWSVLGVSSLLWGGRYLMSRRHGKVRITFPGQRIVSVPKGYSVLEASRAAGIPHGATCGGRGRCTTCRVRIQAGNAGLPPAAKSERVILEHVNAPENVRLACQLRPDNDISVVPLVSVATTRSNDDEQTCLAGREQEIVVLFADLRGFTSIAEKKLPYDVVFLLNRYFDVVGDAIEYAGGTPNQFTGDGVMALFGMKVSAREAARQALAAVCEMVRGLEALSGDMAEELGEPLRVGIGIHIGQAVVGHMGRGIAMYLTAVGDTVHLASRFQELTKEYDCQLVVSEKVISLAGIEVEDFPRREVTVRNRKEPVAIRIIHDVDQLGRCVALFPGPKGL